MTSAQNPSLPPSRLDAAMADRGLVSSRTRAARLISAGLVTVDGKPAIKASLLVSDSQYIDIAELDHYVSRAAHKLIAALDAFAIDPTGALALDVGASTGGFTQVLLERGATKVIALDVGHGQIATPVRLDPRVIVIEGFNARELHPVALAKASGISELPTIVVADLSFISLGLVLPAMLSVAAGDANFVLLVKPQFEVGRTGIREGLVKSAALRSDAVMNVLWTAWDLGLGTHGVIASPIAGTAGNSEYLVWLRRSTDGNPTEWMTAVTRISAV
jgi:23S rRNA (cytidine1920-2'-O)/16S rRNA (cytidine1409-2'-O)-methyltransferase